MVLLATAAFQTTINKVANYRQKSEIHAGKEQIMKSRKVKFKKKRASYKRVKFIISFWYCKPVLIADQFLFLFQSF